MAKNLNSKPKQFDDEWGKKEWPAGKPARPLAQSLGPAQPLEGEALVKETCRRLRAAKGLWDAHRNPACRREREKALALYNQLTKAQKEKIPQQLRIWLRYRSEKYFGDHQTKPGGSHPTKPSAKKRSAKGQRSHTKKQSRRKEK